MGHDIYMVDTKDEVLFKAMDGIGAENYTDLINNWDYKEEELQIAYSKIRATTDLEIAVKDADFITEAIVENAEAKNNLFKEIAKYARDDAILGTNTIRIPIEDIAKDCEKPERILGLRFMHPVMMMNVIKFKQGENTSEETVQRARGMFAKMNKKLMTNEEYCLSMREREQQKLDTLERRELKRDEEEKASRGGTSDSESLGSYTSNASTGDTGTTTDDTSGTDQTGDESEDEPKVDDDELQTIAEAPEEEAK